jgi:hypothetical protein
VVAVQESTVATTRLPVAIVRNRRGGCSTAPRTMTHSVTTTPIWSSAPHAFDDLAGEL